MHFKSVCLTLLAVAGAAVASSDEAREHQHLKRMDATLKSQLHALKSMYGTPTLNPGPFKTPLPGLEQPETKVMQAIITGVPASVMGDLVVPKSRSSLAAQFKAGHTPAWYEDLPHDAKEYINRLRVQTANGGISATTTFQTTTGPGAADATDTSSDFAPQATANGMAAAGAAGAAGLMGVIMAL